MSTDAATHPAYRPDIDGLRALAVLSVVIYHAFPDVLQGGFAGVDVFFVISGFLITTILLKSFQFGTFSLANFYARRIRRLFPSLAVVLAVTLVAGCLFLLPNEFTRLGGHALAGAGFVSNIVLAQQSGYFVGIAQADPLLHLWSLGIEEQFYLVWPLLLWLVASRKWRLGPVLALGAMASFIYCVYLVGTNITLAFYSPLSRFWELAAGGLLAWLFLHPQRWAVHSALWLDRVVLRARPDGRESVVALHHTASVLGVSLLLVAFLALEPTDRFPGAWALLPVVGAMLLISAGPRAWVNRLVLSRRIMVWFGLISYPLYLWHWPLLAYLATAHTNASPAATRNAILGAIALSILLAWLCYRYVERPFRTKGGGRAKVASLCTAMGATCVMAFLIVAYQGLPGRIPADVRELVTADLRNASWTTGLRHGVCHNMYYLGLDRSLGTQADCFPPTKPRVLLWGDSFAASLYAGLSALQEHWSFSIWQTTTDATGPYFDDRMFNHMNTPMSVINNHVLDRIRASPPDVVLLHATWAGYSKSPTEIVDELRITFERIRGVAPQARIVVLGPVPTWRGTLQQNIFNYSWQEKGPLPQRYMAFGISPTSEEFEKVMAVQLPEMGVTYISARAALCNEQGCLARLGPGPEGLAYVDAAHLSPQASVVLVSQIAQQLMHASGAAPIRGRAADSP